jgi:Ca2+-transporting ATPase
MLYGGTVVAAGRGRAVVTATGPATEAARVRQLIEAQRAPRAPLVLRLGRLTNQVAAVGLGGALAAALAGLARGRPLGRVLRTAVALGVAALPEGLPVVSTAALVRCMQRLRERGMVVRRLGSAETLGGVTVICADKTGTLTQNQMRLEVLEVAGAPIDLQTTRARPQALFRDLPTLALAAGVLNSDVEVQRGGGGVALAGSATERALVEAARQAGLDVDALRAAYPRRVLRSRGNGLHYVISVHDAPARRGGAYAFIKGAPEQVLPLCAGDNAGPLTDERRRQLGARAEALAEQGLRVLALGYCRLRDPEAEALPGFTFLGFAGLRDPLRPGAARAVRAAAGAGIRTLVLTGDHSRTAAAVARQVGLRGAALSGDGSLAERLRDPQVRARLHRLAVLSRVTPEDKLAAVAALRGQGDIVAMVGDGINDAPALKAADVGIAVGRGASDLARQVADVVLAREDLHSILVAVAEGRIVQDNLRRALRFLLATNLSELTLVLGAAVAGAPDPLTPLQLLWLNLLTDTLPGLALALAPGDPEVLDRGPAPPGAPLLPAPLLRPIVRDGLLMSALGAAGFLTGAAPGAFGALSGAQLAYTTVCQAPGPGPDPLFLKLVGGSIGVQLLSLVVSPVRAALGLPGAAGREVLLFLLGLVLPWFAGRLDGEVIIRRGLMADGE